MMEAHLDKSSATSDSGGLIDLSAINSDSPASKKGELSPDETNLKGGGDGELPREGKGGGESSGGGGWLLDYLDLDSKLQGAKFIHEEVFDFEIPEEYLNISLDAEQPLEEDSLSLEDKGDSEAEGATGHTHQEKLAPCEDVPQPPVQSKKRESCLVDIESEPSASGNSTEPHHPCIAEMNGQPLIAESLENSFKEEQQETCENVPEDASRERRSDSADSGVFGIRSESSQTHFEDEGLRPTNPPVVEPEVEETPSNCHGSDLISFAPGGFPKTENKSAENSCGCEGSCAKETDNGVLGMEGECVSVAAELPLEKASDVPTSICVQSDCNQPPVLGLEQWCSNVGVGGEARPTVSSNGVGREVKERRKSSRLPAPNRQLRKCSTFDRSPVKCSLVEELKEVSREMKELDLQSHLDLSSTTFVLPKPEETTKPSASDGLGQQSKSEGSAPLVTGSVRPISTDPAPANSCANRKVPKPSIRPSLLPSKSTSAIPNCKLPVPRRPADKPPARPSMLPKSGSSQLPRRLPPKFKIPTSTSTTFRDHTNLRPRQEERSKIAPPTKPLKALGHMTSTNTLKAPAGTRTQFAGMRSKVPQVGTQKSKLHAAPHAARRSSNPTVGSQDTCGQSVTTVSLSTSLVYSASPQQSTPIKSAKKTPTRRAIITPKNLNSTPELPHATFSLSSIEGSSTPSYKEPHVREPPRTNETYTVGPAREGGGSTSGVQTPQSNKRKRRSFIPTPNGQNRLVSPVPYNPSSPCESSPHCEKKSMPPPKARRLLNPRGRPTGLQRRGRGGMARGGTRIEGPMKAKRMFAFGGGYDFESELPVPRTRVVHSPVDKENRPATPHSEWSPIRRKKHLTLEEASIQCTKRVHH